MAGKGIKAGEGYVELSVNDDALTKGLKAAEGKFKQWSASLGAIGRNALQLGGMIMGGLAPGVALFGNYEQSLADLRAAANPTADEFARLRTQIEALGKATGTDFNDVTKAYSELLKAGLSVNQVLGGVGETVVRFSRVAGLEMGQTATVLVDAMTQFAREGLSASEVVNIMNQSADASTISLRDVSDAFANGGSVAATFGQNMRDTATAIAIFGQGGIKGAEAGTTLRTILMRLATGTEGAAGAINELGLEVRDSAGNLRPLIDIVGQLDRALAGRGGADRDRLLADLGGAYGIRGLTTLLASGTAGWERMQQSMSGALTVEQKFDIQMATLLGTAKKLWVNIQAIAVAVGEALQPALDSIGRVLMPAFEIVEAFVKENAVAVQVIAAIGAALVIGGAAALALSFALGAAGSAFAAMASSVAGISAGVAFLWQMYLYSDVLKYGLLAVTGILRAFGIRIGELWGPLDLVDDMFDSIFDTIAGFASGTIFEEIGASIASMWATLLDSPVGEFIQTLGYIVVGIAAVNAAIVGLVGYLAYLSIANQFDLMVRGVRAAIPYIELMFDIWLEYLATIGRLYATVWSPIISLGRGVVSTVTQIYTAATAAFSSAWSTTVAEFSRLVAGLTATAGTAWETIRAAFGLGDWQMIWQTVRVAAELAWTQIKGFIEPTFAAWKDALEDTFDSAFRHIKAAFVELWGEMRATALNALANIADSMGMTERADILGTEALAAQRGSALDAANIRDGDGNARAILRDTRAERDAAAAAGNTAEVNRLQGVLDGLNRQATDNALVDFWQRTEENGEAGPLSGLRMGGGGGTGNDLGGWKGMGSPPGTFVGAAMSGLFQSRTLPPGMAQQNQLLTEIRNLSERTVNAIERRKDGTFV